MNTKSVVRSLFLLPLLSASAANAGLAWPVGEQETVKLANISGFEHKNQGTPEVWLNEDDEVKVVTFARREDGLTKLFVFDDQGRLASSLEVNQYFPDAHSDVKTDISSRLGFAFAFADDRLVSIDLEDLSVHVTDMPGENIYGLQAASIEHSPFIMVRSWSQGQSNICNTQFVSLDGFKTAYSIILGRNCGAFSKSPAFGRMTFFGYQGQHYLSAFYDDYSSTPPLATFDLDKGGDPIVIQSFDHGVQGSLADEAIVWEGVPALVMGQGRVGNTPGELWFLDPFSLKVRKSRQVDDVYWSQSFYPTVIENSEHPKLFLPDAMWTSTWMSPLILDVTSNATSVIPGNGVNEGDSVFKTSSGWKLLSHDMQKEGQWVGYRIRSLPEGNVLFEHETDAWSVDDLTAQIRDHALGYSGGWDEQQKAYLVRFMIIY